LDVLGLARHPDGLADVVEADLSDDASIGDIAAHLDRPVRMAIHVAGPVLAGGVAEVTTEAVLEAVDVKVNGLLRLVRAVDGHLVSGARIVAITGHLGYDPVPASVTAGVANAAVAALVRQLARAYGPRGVTCHAIAPGPVESPRLDRLIDHLASAAGSSADEARAALMGEAPAGRLATPEDVAWAVGILLDDAAAMMDGSTLFLDGGRRTSLP
jgi:NAD(P)-dependent dehydrogenase (short-subunit alcohol dehydrogenase family)